MKKFIRLPFWYKFNAFGGKLIGDHLNVKMRLGAVLVQRVKGDNEKM